MIHIELHPARFALYSPSIDRFMYTHYNLDVMCFLSAVASSKLITIIYRLDTAKNFKQDFDNDVCRRYTIDTGDYTVFQVDRAFNDYTTYNGNLKEYHFEIVNDFLFEVFDLLTMAEKVKNYFDDKSNIESYLNVMCPELRNLTGKDFHALMEKCYQILYTAKSVNEARSLLKNVIDITL